LEEYTWCGRFVWYFTFVVTEFVFPDEKIQTEMQNFLFCRWKKQVKMSHRYLSPNLHGVTSQKIVIDTIYVTRVNRKVLHGAVPH
jgi:hypothetical protein